MRTRKLARTILAASVAAAFAFATVLRRGAEDADTPSRGEQSAPPGRAPDPSGSRRSPRVRARGGDGDAPVPGPRASETPHAADDDSAAPREPSQGCPPPPEWRPAALEWRTEVVLPGDAHVSGRLRGEDGAAVAGAILRGCFLRCRGGFGEYAGRGSGDSAGQFGFRIDRLPDEPVGRLFDVRAAGFVPGSLSVTAEQEAALRRGERLEGLELVLRRAATVVGVLALPDGRSAGNAVVGVAASDSDISPSPWMSARTDRRGRFLLAEIDPADAGWIVASWTEPGSGTSWQAAPVALGGRVAAGRTDEIALPLERQNDAELTIVFRDWREGLEFAGDGGLSWFDCPRELATNELTGRHRFQLRDPADREWRHEFTFTIPHGTTSHRIVVDIP